MCWMTSATTRALLRCVWLTNHNCTPPPTTTTSLFTTRCTISSRHFVLVSLYTRMTQNNEVCWAPSDCVTTRYCYIDFRIRVPTTNNNIQQIDQKTNLKLKTCKLNLKSRTKTIVGVVGRNKCHIKGMNHRLDLKATRLLYSDRCQKNICHTFQGQRAHQQLSTTDDCKMEAVFYVCEGGNFGIFQTKSRLMTTLVRPLIRTLRVPGIESKMMTNLRRYWWTLTRNDCSTILRIPNGYLLHVCVSKTCP